MSTEVIVTESEPPVIAPEETSTGENDVAIAEVEADAMVSIAEVHAEAQVEQTKLVVEAEAERHASNLELEECRQNIATLRQSQTKTDETLALILERLTPAEPPPQNPPEAAENPEAMPANPEAQEPTEEKKKLTHKRRNRWI